MYLKTFINKVLEGKVFVPSVSVQCVIFGYDLNGLKILLSKPEYYQSKWIIPGGYIQKNEDMDSAALRTLKIFTGLDDIYLSQFSTFDFGKNSNQEIRRSFFQHYGKIFSANHWYAQRFINVGYIAMVNFDKTTPLKQYCFHSEWFDILNLPDVFEEHSKVVESALLFLREKISHVPVGLKLLPTYFTLRDLQNLYEIILDRKLSRSNFQRYILGLDILQRHSKKIDCPYNAPYLYSFDKEKYGRLVSEWGLEMN